MPITSIVTLLTFFTVSLLAALAWIFTSNRRAQAGLQQQLQQQATLLEDKSQQQRQALAAQNEAEKSSIKLAAEKEALNQSLAEKTTVLDRLNQSLSQQQQAHEQTQQRLSDEQLAHGKLSTQLEEKQQGFDRQIQQLNESRNLLKKEFEVLANEILEAKGKAFKAQNSESIQHLLSPLKEEMKTFKERVETIHKSDVEQHGSLKAELTNLQKLNQGITDQAAKLTNALRTEKKKQGNWGELILENVLDSSGLQLGKDYTTQKGYKDEEGNTQFPDAIVHLPQNKHLIIDAKTSLNAYTDFVNCEDEVLRQKLLTEHAKAVADRINELSDKNYFNIPSLNSPEVVIMFIPVESAYVEALRFDANLYQQAIEKNILVSTPTTLLTSLNIVRQLWRFEDQNKHTAELANRAEKFYRKLNSFLTSMEGVGKQLDKAKDSYDKAFGQLYSGRGNLIKQAAEFKDLGVSVQAELPSELIDKAYLELEI